MKIRPDKAEQIRAILSHFFIGKDGWADAHLRPGQRTEDVAYEDLFTVDEQDVLAYVRSHGWDSRVVRQLEAMPTDPEQVSWDWRFFLLPPREGLWICGRRVDTERRSSPYEMWEFGSRDAMERFVVRDLMEAQRNLWGRGPVLDDASLKMPSGGPEGGLWGRVARWLTNSNRIDRDQT